jgi:hypothetical protein
MSELKVDKVSPRTGTYVSLNTYRSWYEKYRHQW